MPAIAEIQTITFRLPMHGSLSWGKAGKLEGLEHVLVQVITDTGQVGIAEATPRPTIYGETAESIHIITQKHLTPRLIGMDINNIEAINDAMSAIANNYTAKGAIDIAIHHAMAKTQGQTLVEYLNPRHRKVKVSYILGIADQKTMVTEAERVYEQGVRVLKVKVGRNFEHDVTLIQQLQREFEGMNLSLYADANEGMLPNEAQPQLKKLADLGILYVEEPLPVELLQERADLRQSDTIPLIADDSTFTLRDLKRELRFDTFDILNIKTARTGYTLSQQMLAAAKQHHKGVMIGSQASSTIGTVRAAIFAGLDGVEHPSELSFFLKIKGDIVNRRIEIKDGFIDLDSLGDIDVDETALKEFRLN